MWEARVLTYPLVSLEEGRVLKGEVISSRVSGIWMLVPKNTLSVYCVL